LSSVRLVAMAPVPLAGAGDGTTCRSGWMWETVSRTFLERGEQLEGTTFLSVFWGFDSLDKGKKCDRESFKGVLALN
jgi:hypothetical protein